MSAPVLSLHGVQAGFDGRVVLTIDRFEVAAGERVAVIGPSGAGKTTLLRVCAGLAAPQAGEVRLFGHDPAALGGRRLRRLRSRVGVLYQHLHLVGPLRVVHNVNGGHLGRWGTVRALRSLVRPVDVDAAREALGRVGLADLLGERTDRLSGGEQQRVALARLLVQQPELIVADEPVSSLDRAHAEAAMDLLCPPRRAGGEVEAAPALVVALHDFDLARRRCDRLVGVRDGVVVFDRRAAEVGERDADELYRLRR